MRPVKYTQRDGYTIMMCFNFASAGLCPLDNFFRLCVFLCPVDSAQVSSESSGSCRLAQSPLRRARQEQLARAAGYKDADLFKGRFERKVKDHRKGECRSTRASTVPDGADPEEALRRYLKKDLPSFFANQNDANLFLKVIVSDGIVSCLIQNNTMICFVSLWPMAVDARCC